jgi:phenylacetate-CoA ligase
LPLIGRIIGRSDDMLKIRGVMVYPSQIEDVIASHPQTVKEAWQIYVARSDRDLDRATVAVERSVHASSDAAEIAADVRAQLRARLGLNLDVEVHDEGRLPRYEAKAVRVIVRDS